MAPRSEVIPIYLRVVPADIAHIKSLFESYEEVGIVRTVDRQVAVIVLLTMRDFLADARALIAEITAELDCVEIPRPSEERDDWLMREI